jgi:hypothetical protein
MTETLTLVCSSSFVSLLNNMKDNVLHVHIHDLEIKWLTEGSISVYCCFGLEVNANKTKYMVMSRDQNVG